MSMGRVEETNEEKKELLLTERRRYPTVFKWKIATLVIAILITAFLITDILFIVYLNNNQPRSRNYNFATDLIKQLFATAMTTAQFGNMMTALATSYDEFGYQGTNLVGSWAQGASKLSPNRLVEFFTTKIVNRLTLVMITDGTASFVVGAFTHIAFQVPSSWSTFLGENKAYFNFQTDDRQSTLLGGNSPTYLKMDGSDQNLTNCKVMRQP